MNKKKFRCSYCGNQVDEICPNCWKCLNCCICEDRRNGTVSRNGRKKVLN